MDYVELHLGYAVKKLCIGEKDVRKRLLEAWDSDLNLLTCNNNFHFNNYPDEIKKDWKWIYEQLNQREPEYKADGSV